MGFDFELLQPPDNAFGTLQLDGTWNGMINELIKDVCESIMIMYKLFIILNNQYTIININPYRINKMYFLCI